MSSRRPVLELVVFHAGQTRFAIEARHVAAARDGEIPADALRLSETSAGRARVLALSNGATLVAQEPIAWLTIGADAIRPIPPLMAMRSSRREIRAIYWDSDGPVFIADPQRWR